MENTLFTKPEDLDSHSEQAIGGKAAGLLLLHAARAPVPPWVVLPAERASTFNSESPETREDLAALFSNLSPCGEGVAVRSSGLSEDLSAASAAGFYDTCFCTIAEEIPDAIERVLQSGRGYRASSYGGLPERHPHVITAGTPAPARLRPVPHSFHGPLAHDRMAVIVQRRIRPILSGVAFSAHPARARYDLGLIEAVHGDCTALVNGAASPSRFEIDLARGECVIADPGADGPATLDAELVTTLRHWLLTLEDAFDAALDIEWATDAAGLWLLQARPITRLALDPDLRPPVPATSWFFDQRFHEPIHPITRTSLLPLILRTGIEDALALRGWQVPDPLSFDYGGQCYVNLEAYHRLLRDVPRGQLTPDLRQLFPDDMQKRRLPSFGLLWRGLVVLWRERGRSLGNVGVWDEFRDNLGQRLAAIPDVGAEDHESWRDAWRRMDDLTEEFLRIHRWSIVLADYAYNVFLLVTRIVPAGLRDRIRKRVLQRVWLVTAAANAARARLGEGDGENLAFYLSAYGHRSTSLDYAAPTWAETLPRKEIDTTPKPERKCSTARGNAGLLVRLLEMREEQRFHWERILARQRALLLDAGHALEEQGLLADYNDIWWLEWDEVQIALAENTALEPARIALRRRQHRINVPVRRPTHIAPAGGDPEMKREASSTLRGVGASSGSARGTAFVVCQLKDLPDSIPEGTILILPCLDPAWTPILRYVAGLVIERGGLLSHAAIIAREYGIPLVIGVEGATECIRNGDTIEVDGDAGAVRCDDGRIAGN